MNRITNEYLIENGWVVSYQDSEMTIYEHGPRADGYSFSIVHFHNGDSYNDYYSCQIDDDKSMSCGSLTVNYIEILELLIKTYKI